MTRPLPHRRLREAILRQAKAPALLVTDLTNIFYLTGQRFSVAQMLISRRKMMLFIDDRYRESALRHCPKYIEVLDRSAIGAALKNLRRCAIESETMTIDIFDYLQRKYRQTKFVRSSGVLDEVRRSKHEAELRCVRRAIAITKRLLKRVPRLLVTGISERGLAWRLRTIAHEEGAEDMAFETIVAFGRNTSHPHHRPTNDKFKTGDLVQIDIGVKYRGYCSDFSRVFLPKSATDEQHRVYKILSSVQRRSKAGVRAGVTNHALDAAARRALKTYGFDREFCHALGHGVGLEIHEGPVLSGKAPKKKLLRGEVVTIEPGLYFEGKWGMRIEDTVIVK